MYAAVPTTERELGSWWAAAASLFTGKKKRRTRYVGPPPFWTPARTGLAIGAGVILAVGLAYAGSRVGARRRRNPRRGRR